MKKRFRTGLSKRKMMLILSFSIIPLLLWSIANYYWVRESYGYLIHNLIQNKRSQFNRHITYIRGNFEKFPENYSYDDYLKLKTKLNIFAGFMKIATYASIDGKRDTFNWKNKYAALFSQPFIYSPELQFASYFKINGTDTLLICYSISDILKISGISESGQQFREHVAYFDPLGKKWNLDNFPPLELNDDRLIPGEDGIFESSNFIGWDFNLPGSPARRKGGKFIIAYEKADILGNWYTYQDFLPVGLGMLIIILTLILYFFGINVTRELKQLIKAAKAMGEGNFDHEIKVDGSEEIYQLAEAIEEMRLKLKSIYQDLELTVNKRTRDLQEAQFQVVHQEKMASIGLLAAGIAHEIGNPLTSISSMVQLMKRKIDDPKLISYLTTIHQNIERISKIVRELVDFSRPSRSELVLTNVTKTIEAAVGIIKYDKRARDIDFFLKLDEDIPEILIVEDQLMQVFVNILVNAVDAIKEEPKRIEVRTNFNDEFIFIEFKDSGVGISKSMQKRIFEPFFTTKEVGKGTGLGLSVSYGIVQNFGGTITVESTPGVSTIFTIILPITEENGKVPELLRKKLDE